MKPKTPITGRFQSTAKLIFLYLLVLSLGATGCSHKPTIAEKVQASLDSSKQQWFNEFHPLGTAKSIKLHHVETMKGANGWQAVARFTIYWQGPIQKDGFTKIKAV